MKKGILMGLLVLLLCSCSPKQETIKVGVVGTNEEEIWLYVKKELEKEDIFVEVITFTDYQQPNEALASGEIDLNAFQHYDFLQVFIKKTKKELAVIGETYLSPLGLYSKKITSVNQIKKGDIIALPSDPTNLGRALQLLESAGLITLQSKNGELLGLEDVKDNPLELTLKELDASQTARALEDVTASIINGGMAVDAGLVPEKDAIYLEQLTRSSKPYINVIVSRKEEADHKVFEKIVKRFQTDDVAEHIKKVTRGACLPIWTLED